MKNKTKISFILSICLLIVGLSCSDSESNDARIQLRLVDAPGDYLEVNVEIVDVQYNSSEDDLGWRSFDAPEEQDYPIYVDLTELIAGNNILLADQDVPAGMLKQIRLVLGTENTLVIDGEPEAVPLNTPSAQQSGLKLKLDTQLEPGFTYSYILDWDVQKSIVKAGNSGNYNLKPVIRVEADATSGSISGSVFELIDDVNTPMEGIVISLSSGTDSDITTSTDVNGDFLFAGVDPDNSPYTLSIEHEGYQTVEITGISVTVGSNTAIDPIEMIKE